MQTQFDTRERKTDNTYDLAAAAAAASHGKANAIFSETKNH